MMMIIMFLLKLIKHLDSFLVKIQLRVMAFSHLRICVSVGDLFRLNMDTISGYLLTISQCLEITHLKEISHTDWSAWVNTILEILSEVITLSMQILGGQLHSTKISAPSFQQMGQVIQNIIAESSEGSPINEETNLTSEHQSLMAWAWTNIKVIDTLGILRMQWINIFLPFNKSYYCYKIYYFF